MKRLLDLFSPATWCVALIAIVVFGLHVTRQEGYDDGYALAEAEGKTTASDLREAFALERQALANAAAVAAQKSLAELRTEQAKGNQLASQLADTKDELRKKTEKLTGEIARVTTLYRRALDAQPGACTINDGLGPVALIGRAHTGLQGGELVANGDAWVEWNASVGTGAYILLFCTGAPEQVASATQGQHALPLGQATALFAGQPGKIEWFASMTPPATHLAANGSAVSRTTYANLFSAIAAQPTGAVTSGSKNITGVVNASSTWVGMPISGPGIPPGTTVASVAGGTITLSANATATTASATLAICPYGIGDGSTTFNVPDLRGKVARGWDNGAGVDTGRVLGSYQADAYASHNHGINDPGHSHYVNDPGHFHTLQAAAALVSLAGGGLQYGVISGAQNTQSAGTGIWLGSSATGISTQVAGGGAETRMKNLALLACIKF